MHSEILAALDRGATVLTPNRRLTATLKRDIETLKLRENAVIVSPNIQPFSVWLEQHWAWLEDLGVVKEMLLSPLQERVLWQEVVKASQVGPALLSVTEAAKLSQQAYRRVTEWLIDRDDAAFDMAEDTFAFKCWSLQVEQKCQENGWCSPVTVPFKLIEHAHRLPHQAIALYGFETLSPLQERLIQHLQSHGWQVEALSTFRRLSRPCQIVFQHAENELVAAAHWAFERYQANPTARIGIVINNLEDERAHVERVFSQVFENSHWLRPEPAVKDAFNISAGQMLSTFPIVQTALLIGRWMTQSLTLHEAGYVLQSPFILMAEDSRDERARAEAALREIGHERLSLRRFTKLVNQIATGDGAEALSIQGLNLDFSLKQALSIQETLVGKKAVSEWGMHIAQALTAMGWPGQRPLDSAEYQVMQRWQQCLLDLSELDEHYPEASFAQAIQSLQSMASQTVFQIQSKVAQVQILGPLEAAGLPFDALWVTHVTDDAWPAKAKPNPMIPLVLQRKHQVPQSTAERELEYARRILKQFKQTSQELIVSWARQERGGECAPSELIRDFEQVSFDALGVLVKEDIKQLVYKLREHSWYLDEVGPQVSDTEAIRGGSWLVKAQASCPFKAFAQYRLQAKGLGVPAYGLTSMDRGLVVHLAMRAIWQSIKTQAALKALDFNDRAEMVDGALSAAFDHHLAGRQELRDSKYCEIEHECLRALIVDWLCIESERPNFKIKLTEAWHDVRLAGLELHVQIDRIDVLDDGSQLLIDYKTGQPKITSWFGERPEEPQLPLYNLALGNQASGLSYAILRRGRLGFKGIAAHELDISGIEDWSQSRLNQDGSDWSRLRAEWHATLTDRVEDFMTGQAQVDPKHPMICANCELHGLCRVHELNRDD